MAGHVLVFIIALSTGIFLYQTIIAAQDTILIASENYTRRAESASSLETDNIRVVKGSEIYGTLMSALESTDVTAVIQKDDFNPDIIVVNGHTIKVTEKKKEYANSIYTEEVDDSLAPILFKELLTVDINGDYTLEYNILNDGTIVAIYK